MKPMKKLCLILVAATALAALPTIAQESPAGAATNAAPAKPRPQGFAGRISAVDSANMTITLHGRSGETKVKVTSETKITKNREPATFADAVEGMTIRGQGKQGEDGVWVATRLAIRPPPPKVAAPAAPAAPATPPPSDSK
jgi:hypothetical protein